MSSAISSSIGIHASFAFSVEVSAEVGIGYGRLAILSCESRMPLDATKSRTITPEETVGHDDDDVGSAYRRNYELLRFLATQRFCVPAEDVRAIIHDVFVSYMRHYPRIRNERAWLVGALSNACREYWIRCERRDVLESLLKDGSSSQRSDSVTERVDVAAVLAQLSSRCREVLRLRFLEGCSTDELAASLATTANNAKQLVHRCTASARAIATAVHRK